MHDPANLETIVNLIVYGVLAWIAFAVGGAVYLVYKYGEKLGRIILPQDPGRL